MKQSSASSEARSKGTGLKARKASKKRERQKGKEMAKEGTTGPMLSQVRDVAATLKQQGATRMEIVRVLGSQFPDANPNVIKQALHDVFVKFAQSGDRIGLAGSLKNYLVTSVINRTRNYRRDSHRRGETSLEGAETLLSTRRGPEQWAVVSEQLTLLSRALEQLPYEQREVVCFRAEMNMTFRQIAAIQKTPVNTVKGRYRYAMEKLRSRLDSEVTRCDPQMI